MLPLRPRVAAGRPQSTGRALRRRRRWARLLLALLALLVLPGAAGEEAALPAPVPEALPGAAPFPPELRRALSRALAARGPDRAPRTRHLDERGRPLYTNRLLLETSPYLEQHAHNPVDWHAWGDDAFALARRLERPVFVSIGYSTCHWCHVMEEESFDDAEIARLLNGHFVAIKVDRELRPDVDAVYLSAVQAMTGSAGWPLNVWLTPDREPFYGGTYFPREARGGRRGFGDVLRALTETWREERAQLQLVARDLRAAVEADLGVPPATSSGLPDAADWRRAVERHAARIDPEWGGVGRRTKFPATVPVRMLLRYQRRSGDDRARDLALLTLDRMAAGGLRDHVGGGFHRYATDPRWRVPHFEKMLYDNALLARAYLEAYEATGRPRYRAVAEETLDYAAREMRGPGGGFYSATDADSEAPDGESREGAYYTWTEAELAAVLDGPVLSLVRDHYAITPEGDLDGRNVLRIGRPLEELAQASGEALATLEARRDAALATLRRARARRPPPLRDEKQLAAWNGLMISAFARAAFALERDDYADVAVRAAEHVLERLHDPATGRLQRVALGEKTGGPAFLDDYAFLIAGLLDLHEVRPEPRWLARALALQSVLDRDYADPAGGYFASAHEGPRWIERVKPSRDGATPSGTSVTALNLLRLAALTGDAEPAGAAARLLSTFRPLLRESPTALSELWIAVDFALDRAREVVLVDADPPDPGLLPLLDVVRRVYAPNRVLLVVREGDDLAAHRALVPWLRGKRALDGRATAYVCEDHVCALPTSDPAELRRQLAVVAPLSAGAGADAARPEAAEVAGPD